MDLLLIYQRKPNNVRSSLSIMLTVDRPRLPMPLKHVKSVSDAKKKNFYWNSAPDDEMNNDVYVGQG